MQGRGCRLQKLAEIILSLAKTILCLRGHPGSRAICANSLRVDMHVSLCAISDTFIGPLSAPLCWTETCGVPSLGNLNYMAEN